MSPPHPSRIAAILHRADTADGLLFARLRLRRFYCRDAQDFYGGSTAVFGFEAI